jgi:signal transduction histidine kinase
MKLNLIPSSNPLVRRVTLAHWGLLGLTIILETIVLGVQGSATTTARTSVCIGLLTALAVFSLYWPQDKPRWFRLVFCFLELSVLAAASLLGIYRWIWPMYLVLTARAALLTDDDDLPKVVLAACVAQFAWYFVHAFVTLPGTAWTQMFATAMLSALMMTASTCILVVVVAVLMRSLISEQLLRQETERLARENEVLATELERTRIAREIHDTVGHSLTSLKIQLELANKLIRLGDDRAKDAVSQAEQLAARSLTDTRVALQSIRNADFNFEKALDELVRELRSTGAVQVNVECNQMPKMSNAISYQLYRVIQECMTNTLKHAQAKALSVRLVEEAGSVRLEVNDDGKGFETDFTSDGFGLKGLRERISSLRGEVIVASATDKGTSVTVCVPLLD